jgi:hypothetical protein
MEVFMKKYLFITILLASSFLLYGQFSARELSRTGEIPDLISFQGRLTDSMGNPITDNLTMRFSVYDNDTGGVALWIEDRTVSVSDGLFQINLGEVTPLTESYFTAESRWLGVRIGTDSELTPRIRIASSPYALQALESDPTWTGEANATGDIGRTGKVGIGIISPEFPLHISGEGDAEIVKIYNSQDQPSSFTLETDYSTWRVGQNKPPDQPTQLDGFFIYDSDAELTRFYISSNGNVSIGAINPTVKLDIDGRIRIRGGSPGTGKVLTSNDTGLASWEEPSPIAETDPTWNGAASITGNIGRTGSVGIGTTVPTALLDVHGGDAIINYHTIGRGGGASSSNFAAGYQALSSNTSGYNNTAVGYQSMMNNTTGTFNTAHGYRTLSSNTTGSSNIAIGFRSLEYNETASYNTATGILSLNLNSTGFENSAFGYRSLYNNTEGHNNTAAGYYSLTSNTEGVYNIAVGSNSLASNTTGNSNTAIGYRSLFHNIIGDTNTAIGSWAIHDNTEGQGNTATGYYAMGANTTGNFNTANGTFTLRYNTIGSNNTAIGRSALLNNTEGNNNTAVGALSLNANTTGHDNSAGGFQSLYYTTSGEQNTAFGSQALYNNTSGNYNTATGYWALRSSIGSNHNTANGYYALSSNTSGTFNSAFGSQALEVNTSGMRNSAFGSQSLLYNTTGSDNSASGWQAMRNNTTGYNNTAMGKWTLYENIEGHNNAVLGLSAGDYSNFNAQGTFVGALAYTSTSYLTNIAGYGYSARPTASNQVRVGNSSVTSIGGYTAWTNLSDSRYKKDIRENVSGLEFIMKLRPITYHLDVHKLASYLTEDQRRDENGNPYIASPDNLDLQARNEKEAIQYTGFIAQEVEVAAREVGFDFSGVDSPKNEKDLYGLRYAEFVVPLVKAVQELSEINRKQDDRIKNLENEIEHLKALLGQ